MVAANENMVTFKGRTDVGHIPYQPFWLLIVRGIQLLLAILVLALSAYAGSGYIIFYAGYGIGIFSFIWTLLFLCYIEITTFWFPAAYNKYAHLALECLCVVFWLSTFAALAADATVADWTYNICSYSYCYKLKKRTDYSGPAGATKAAAALGAFEWALFIATLVTYGIYLHRHRMEELQARMGVAAPTVVEEHKMGPVVPQQPVYAQQPVYGGQAPIDPRYQQVNMA